MAPVLFVVPGTDLEIQSYGLLLGLALVVGWVIALSLARKDRLPAERLGLIYVLGAGLGIFAARGVWLVQHPDQWQGAASLASLQAGGLAPFAGITVALVVSALLVSRIRVPVTAWFDVLAPAFAVGTVLERLGALLAGSGEGRYAPDFPLAISYPQESPVFEHHARELAELLPPGATESLPVHATQVYGILLGVGGVLLCRALRQRRAFSGQIFLLYATYLIVARTFIEEWFRADAVQAVFGPFNPGQIAALLLLLALVSIYRTRARRAPRAEGGLRYWEGGRWSPDAKPPKGAAKVRPGSPEAKEAAAAASGARPAVGTAAPGRSGRGGTKKSSHRERHKLEKKKQRAGRKKK